MPALAEPPFETDLGPFADLIGGEGSAPAYQLAGGRFSEVPKAEIATPTEYGAFADLLPPGSTRAHVGAPSDSDLGEFSDLVPVSPTSESEKALSEAAARYGEIKATPTVMDELQAGRFGNAAEMAYESVRRKVSGIMGPTEKEKSEQMIAWGKNPDGSVHYEYRPLGNRMEREHGLFTSPFVSAETMLKPDADDSQLAKLGKAVYNSTAGIVGTLASPGTAMLGLVGSGSPTLGRVASAGFGIDMLAHVPDAWQAVQEADKTAPGSQERIEAGLNFLTNLVFARAALKHAVKGKSSAEQPLPERESPMPLDATPDELGGYARYRVSELQEKPTLNAMERAELSHLERNVDNPAELGRTYGLEIAGPERAVRPASEPTSAAATMERPIPETPQAVEPALRTGPVKAEPEQPSGMRPVREPDLVEVANDWTMATAEPEVKAFTKQSGQHSLTGSVPQAPANREVRMATAPESQISGPKRRSGRTSQPSDPLPPQRQYQSSRDILSPLKTGLSIETPREAVGAEMGIVAPGTGQLIQAQTALGAAAKRMKGGLTDLEQFHDFRKARLGWSARNQESTGEITRAAKAIQKSIPNPVRRAAITNWIQAGGDTTVLGERAAASNNLQAKRGYEAALTLTPEEQAVAGKVRQTYDILRRRAEAHGIEINELENYVNQIWRRSALKEFGTTYGNKKLSTSVRFAKKRFHDSFFHGEQAGLRPETKDIAKLLPIYLNEVNNAISAKQFVAEMAKGKASDGRPLLAPRGGGKVIEGKGEGDKGAVLVFPDKGKTETSDYRILDQPALHAWKWTGEENGKPILVKGDLAVHPEAYSHLKNMMGESAIREWYRSPSENPLADIPKATVKFLLDDVQQVGKATMLGFLSPFHQVQEGTHAIGHKVNPFGGLEKINLSKPNQKDAAQHGLMLLPDRVSAQQFREGLDGSSRNLVANAVGKFGGPIGRKIKEWSDGYQHFLFQEYIPALKLKTYEHILGRNQKRFGKELAGGEATIEQVKFLSAEQSNAAYGHLNYADMGRNPTLQHIAQTLLLAPDFLEARGRFAGQAMKGIFAKSGREQMTAIATLAATQWFLARALNKTLDDDYHFDEPFAVVVGNRKYTMRSVPEDMYKAYQDWRKFTTGRLSPLVGRGLLEGLSGINYRNEPTTIGETFTNILAGMVPLTLQPATRGLTETSRDNPVSPFEQLLGSLGLHVSRFSPTSKVYHLAKEWQEANGIDRKKGLYPRSKYQQLRYALEDGDFDKARAAYDKLVADGENKTKIGSGFKASITHPFTGSQASDRKFRASLSADDKLIYDAAVKRRQEILRRFRSMRTGKT